MKFSGYFTFAGRVAGAALVIGLILPVSPVKADVVLRQINKTLTATPDGPNNIYNLDVNADGTTDFTFTTIIGIPSDPTFASFAVVNAPFGTQNGAVVDAFTGDGFPTVSRLKTGDIVSCNNLLFDASFDQGNLIFYRLARRRNW